MSVKGLRVSNIAPISEHPADIVRGRTGISIAGVGTVFGIPIAADLTLAGDFWVYDPVTDTLIVKNISSIGAGIYLTTTEGEQHAIYTNLACGAAVTLDCSLANVFDLTLTANCTISITNPPPAGVGGIIQIILRQGGSGSYTVTWPGSVLWQDASGGSTGSAPTLWTAVGAQDDVELSTLDGGATWGGTFLAHPGSGTSFGTPALTLSTTNAAGAASTAIRTDATLRLFGQTPTTQAFGDSAVIGTDPLAANALHKHAMPANPVTNTALDALGVTGQILISDSHSTPLVFADLLQNESQDDLVYASL